MNDREENKYSRNNRIQAFMNAHIALLSADAPALVQLLNNLNILQQEIQNYAIAASDKIKGLTMQKADYRSKMENQALKVSGSMKAYFVLNDDALNAERAHLTKAALHNSRQEGTLYLCENILTMAQEFSAQLIPFGVSAGVLSDFETLVANYRNCLTETRKDRKKKVAARKNFIAGLKECDTLLIVISGIMTAIKDSHQDLYFRFKDGMRIGKSGGGKGKKPDIEEMIAAGEVAVIADYTYNKERTFKIRNKSKNALNWGLSELEYQFSNTSHVLNAKSTSKKRSDTLSSKGNFLIVENLSNSPSLIQVWVGEVEENS
jgi:hypothetical protein